MDVAAMAGDYAAWNYFQSIDSPENSRFVSRFKGRFGAGRVTSDAMEAAYFGVHLWAQAVVDANSEDPRQVRRFLAKQRQAAPEGNVSVDWTNNHTWKTARVGRIRRTASSTSSGPRTGRSARCPTRRSGCARNGTAFSPISTTGGASGGPTRARRRDEDGAIQVRSSAIGRPAGGLDVRCVPGARGGHLRDVSDCQGGVREASDGPPGRAVRQSRRAPRDVRRQADTGRDHRRPGPLYRTSAGALRRRIRPGRGDLGRLPARRPRLARDSGRPDPAEGLRRPPARRLERQRRLHGEADGAARQQSPLGFATRPQPGAGGRQRADAARRRSVRLRAVSLRQDTRSLRRGTAVQPRDGRRRAGLRIRRPGGHGPDQRCDRTGRHGRES